MATGAAHYRKAELLLDTARDAEGGGAMERFALGAAQVHATLALAAATALGTTGVGEADMGEWTAMICLPDDPDDELPIDDDGALNDLGRDYAEEAANRAEAAREGLKELAAEQAEDEQYAQGYLDALDGARHADADFATEAYVDVADAEHYAQRDDYVNAPDFAAEVEHVDYAEAEAVREINEEMAREAAGVESWDQL